MKDHERHERVAKALIDGALTTMHAAGAIGSGANRYLFDALVRETLRGHLDPSFIKGRLRELLEKELAA